MLEWGFIARFNRILVPILFFSAPSFQAILHGIYTFEVNLLILREWM